MKKIKGLLSLLVVLTLLVGVFPGSVSAGLFGPSAKKVTVVLPINQKNLYKQFIARFNDKNKSIQIEPLWGKDQNMLIAANKAPDILSTGDLHLPYQKDIFLDLNSYILKDKSTVKTDDFYPSLLAPLKIDGKQLALPTNFNVGLLYYNKKLFDAAGVKYPTATWTYDDYMAAAKKLTKVENGKVTQWGVSTVFGWWGEWLICVRQAGGDIMKGDKVTLDTPEAIKGLQFFYDKTTAGKYKVAPGPKDDSLGGFGGQKTAMEFGGHTGLWVGYNQIQGLDWDIQVLPKGFVTNKGGELALEGYGIYKKSKNIDAAWQVLKFMTSTEGLDLMADIGKPPARKSSANKLIATPADEREHPKNIEALFKALETGMPLPREKDFINMAIQVVQPYIDKMLEGKLTPAEAGKQATVKANEYLKQVRGK